MIETFSPETKIAILPPSFSLKLYCSLSIYCRGLILQTIRQHCALRINLMILMDLLSFLSLCAQTATMSKSSECCRTGTTRFCVSEQSRPQGPKSMPLSLTNLQRGFVGSPPIAILLSHSHIKVKFNSRMQRILPFPVLNLHFMYQL